MSLFRTVITSTALAVAMMSMAAQAQAQTRIALLVKSLGNGFFEAAAEGAEEAAEEIGDVEIIYTGPTEPTAEAQIEVINTLIAQQVDAIAISANDPDAVVPALQRAMDRGITVVSWDSGVAEEGRRMHLNPSSNDLIGETIIRLAADHMEDETGQVAILSATATATNQNIWIEKARGVLEEQYPNIELVDVVYGDDLSDKSYREAQGLIQSYPDLDAIIAPTTVGIVAAAQAVTDADMIGEINVTGLALPSEMAGHIKSGASKSFAIWNPIDLGYSITHIANALSSGDAAAEAGSSISIGRVGEVTIGEDGQAAMSKPFTYDASNIDKYKDVF